MRKKTFRAEYDNADLGDQRRSERFTKLGLALSVLPSSSLPSALKNTAALEAAYRFLSSPDLDDDALALPHREETMHRCHAQSSVIVAHDTTDFAFPGAGRKGLGKLNDGGQGFFTHMALAITQDKYREPLGNLHLEVWTRQGLPRILSKVSPKQRQKDPTRESLKWKRGVQAVEERLGTGFAVHVMDREADDYGFMARMMTDAARFVLRVRVDRRTDEPDKKLFASAAEAPLVVTREVPLTKRAKGSKPPRVTYRARQARTASLQICAKAVTLERPSNVDKEVPASLPMHVVLVEEINVPAGEQAVCWRLLTNLPIKTAKQVEAIVDAYRARWRIEEYFKALKTGCGIEKKQLETKGALVRLLITYIPIAWRVLQLRSAAHDKGTTGVGHILTPLQIKLLRHKYPNLMPRRLTAQDALLAVAALGGHIKNNGQPGWQVLSRGFERLSWIDELAAVSQEM